MYFSQFWRLGVSMVGLMLRALLVHREVPSHCILTCGGERERESERERALWSLHLLIRTLMLSKGLYPCDLV